MQIANLFGVIDFFLPRFLVLTMYAYKLRTLFKKLNTKLKLEN